MKQRENNIKLNLKFLCIFSAGRMSVCIVCRCPRRVSAAPQRTAAGPHVDVKVCVDDVASTRASGAILQRLKCPKIKNQL